MNVAEVEREESKILQNFMNSSEHMSIDGKLYCSMKCWKWVFQSKKSLFRLFKRGWKEWERDFSVMRFHVDNDVNLCRFWRVLLFMWSTHLLWKKVLFVFLQMRKNMSTFHAFIHRRVEMTFSSTLNQIKRFTNVDRIKVFEGKSKFHIRTVSGTHLTFTFLAIEYQFLSHLSKLVNSCLSKFTVFWIQFLAPILIIFIFIFSLEKCFYDVRLNLSLICVIPVIRDPGDIPES